MFRSAKGIACTLYNICALSAERQCDSQWSCVGHGRHVVYQVSKKATSHVCHVMLQSIVLMLNLAEIVQSFHLELCMCQWSHRGLKCYSKPWHHLRINARTAQLFCPTAHPHMCWLSCGFEISWEGISGCMKASLYTADKIAWRKQVCRPSVWVSKVLSIPIDDIVVFVFAGGSVKSTQMLFSFWYLLIPAYSSWIMFISSTMGFF